MGARGARAGIGWPLLPVPDEHGRLHHPIDVDASVRQAIRVVLSTRPGEQLMRPEFGGGVDRFVHEPNTLVTRTRLRRTVEESLERWEDRISVDRVAVDELPDSPGDLRVEVGYRLRRTGVSRTLGMTLQTGA